jgi:hypothetical protein
VEDTPGAVPPDTALSEGGLALATATCYKGGRPSPTRSSKAGTMNSLNANAAHQDALTWSERLGNLAAEVPASRFAAAFTQLDTFSPAAFPTRLSTILNHLHQRRQRQEQAAGKLRAQEFIMEP